jgi:hypothetical protein
VHALKKIKKISYIYDEYLTYFSDFRDDKKNYSRTPHETFNVGRRCKAL